MEELSDMVGGKACRWVDVRVSGSAGWWLANIKFKILLSIFLAKVPYRRGYALCTSSHHRQFMPLLERDN